jgi:hypothetical protein
MDVGIQQALLSHVLADADLLLLNPRGVALPIDIFGELAGIDQLPYLATRRYSHGLPLRDGLFAVKLLLHSAISDLRSVREDALAAIDSDRVGSPAAQVVPAVDQREPVDPLGGRRVLPHRL